MLRLVEHTQPARREPTEAPLAELLPQGRLLEVSGRGSAASTSTAVSLVIRAQAQQEPVAWVQTADGSLYPPDLATAGVDLDALVAIHVPRYAGAEALVRSAEWLLRSGAFGLVVIDLAEGLPSGAPARWQGRLQALVRKHNTRLCLITQSSEHDPSSGPLIGIRVAVARHRIDDGTFLLRPTVLKDKVGLLAQPASTTLRPPAGFQ